MSVFHCYIKINNIVLVFAAAYEYCDGIVIYVYRLAWKNMSYLLWVLNLFQVLGYTS